MSEDYSDVEERLRELEGEGLEPLLEELVRKAMRKNQNEESKEA